MDNSIDQLFISWLVDSLYSGSSLVMQHPRGEGNPFIAQETHALYDAFCAGRASVEAERVDAMCKAPELYIEWQKLRMRISVLEGTLRYFGNEIEALIDSE